MLGRAGFSLVAGILINLLASNVGAQGGFNPQNSPGMVLREGETMADLGRGDRVSQPAPAALAALIPSENLDINVGNWIIMQPRSDSPKAGLIFYQGAETDPRVYARPLRAVAEQGYRVVIVTMPRHLAIMSPYKANEVIEAMPDMSHWILAGHSMGGAMAAQYASKYPDRINGILFWDAYPANNIDLTETLLAIGQIYRTDMDGKAPDSFQAVNHLLPAHTKRYPIAGAEHTYFGDYILAPHRPKPSAQISLDEQQRIIIASTLDFLASTLSSRK